MTRYLFLARHGEATPDESGLTENGCRQAELLGERLKGIPFSTVHHGPLPRAAETARLIAGHLDGVPVRETEAAGDFVPYVPERGELPPDSADALLGFLDQFTEPERAHGSALAAEAVRQFTGPATDTTFELVVTHTFLIGWLVSLAQDAPQWRWLTLNHGNAALTVVRYSTLSSLLVFNDMAHLPVDMLGQWTSKRS